MQEHDEPSINIIHNLLSLFLPFRQEKIIPDPFDKVILERALNDLMEEVRR